MPKRRLFRASDIQLAERQWADSHGKPTFALMEAAANALQETVLSLWPGSRQVTLFCGAGNNGGDGFLLAAQLKQLGYAVQVGLIGTPKVGSDAERAFQQLQQTDIDIVRIFENQPLSISDSGVIIDALLGSGSRGCPREPYRSVIQAINRAQKPVLSVDVPSGIDVDTGAIADVDAVIQATVTLTFGALKPGLVTGSAKQFVGRLVLANLGLGPFLPAVQAVGTMIDQPQCNLLSRSQGAHKGTMGSVVLMGGNASMGGAIALAAESCARMGPGYVHCLTDASNRQILLSRNPGLLVTDYNGLDVQVWLTHRKNAQEVVVIGPGLGQSDDSQKRIEDMVSLCQSRQQQMVLDADGLNWLAKSQIYDAQWVLTPHSGEAARLLGWEEVARVEADRVSAAQEIQRRYGGICVLKGPGTVVCGADQLWINSSGTPGMARAGMGDVLAGMVGGLLARYPTNEVIAVVATAVWMHGVAGERAQQTQHQESMQAVDLITELSAVWHDMIVQNQ